MKFRHALAPAIPVAICIFTSPLAIAAPAQDPVALFNQEFPDMSYAEAHDAIAEIAAIEGKPLEQVASEQLQIAKKAEAEPRVMAASTGGSIIKDGRLVNAQNSGDSFFTDSATAHVNHGHTGLYVTTADVAEAPGGKLKTRIVPAKGIPVKNAVRLSIKATRPQRNNAIAWAKRHLGVAYNNNFAYNHKVEFHAYNCSQFVWASYKQLGIDLDGNGGTGVYPKDIRESNRVVKY